MSDDVGRPRGRRPLRPATAERDCSDSSDAVARKVPRRSAVGKPRRVHKHTYQTRKEEIDRLSRQMSELTAKFKFLERQSEEGAAGEDEEDKPERIFDPIYARENANAHMQTAVQAQQQALYGAHTMLSDWMNAQFVNPLASFIHLPSNPIARRDTLLAMKQQRLSVGNQFLSTRCQQLDPLKPYLTESRIETAAGDFCCTRFDVHQFHDMKDARLVYDALIGYLFNMEISVTEQLGELVVREDFDSLQEGVSNYRLVSCCPYGVQQEMNTTIFASFDDVKENAHDASFSPAGYGLVISDFVDSDDQYPYRPRENVRRDITAAIKITTHRSINQKSGTSEFVVVMHRAAFVKLHQSELEMDNTARLAMQDAVTSWGDVMIRSIRDRLLGVALL